MTPDLLIMDLYRTRKGRELARAEYRGARAEWGEVDARTRALYDDYLAKSRLAGTALRAVLAEGARLVEAELERHNAQMGRRW